MSKFVCAALASLACLGLAAAASPPGGWAGTYRLHGSARLTAGPALSREVELHADAILEPGREPNELRVHLADGGYACELRAHLDAGEQLSFPSGQTCRVTLRAPDGPGHLEFRLGSGQGQIRGDHLVLRFDGVVTGALSVNAVGVEVLGADSANWMPTLPVRGEARASAEGDRDRSRATQR